VTRGKWGARPPRAITELPWPQVDALAIHYSAAASDENPDYAARVRGIQDFHIDGRGWNDIAYNWLVSRTGVIFEGRGWGVMSAATLGHNSHTYAVCFLGADKPGRDDATAKGRKAIAEVLLEASRLSGKRLGLAHVQHGQHRTLAVGGHRDFTSTDCPGDELYEWITLRGWEHERPDTRVPYPPHFFQWAAWVLGEGAYKHAGPRKGKRPRHPALPVSPVYWLALKRFLRQRHR